MTRRRARLHSDVSQRAGPPPELFTLTRIIVCCSQDGVQETGVSVAFTVRAMDAGPVLAQERVAVDADVQAPELLRNLFKRGTRYGDSTDALERCSASLGIIVH